MAMNNKTSFRNSSLFALTTACLALTASGCKAKSDSIGSVGGDAGSADGTGKDGNSCQSTAANPSKCDASWGPEVSVIPDAAPDTACQYPADSHLNAADDTVWWWRFHWQDANLAATCAAWGADAKVILEVDVPANPSGSGTTLPDCALDTLSTGAGPTCAMANAWHFEAVCTDGQLMVELPSSNTFHGYYHVESTNYPNSPRHLVGQDPHCGRDLYLATGLGNPPATPSDGGVDTAPDGNGCGAGTLIHYAAPGCGAAAVSTCASVADASFTPSSYCACDGVTTLTYDARGVPSPYLYAGACKQDGGPITIDAAPSDAPAAVFCQLSDGRQIPAGAAYASSDKCNCCVCTSSGKGVCQAAGCSDASFANPTTCKSDQDCVRGVCAFEPGCGSPRGTCMSNGACPLIAVSDMSPWEYCGCDGVTFAIVDSSTSPQQYAYKPYSHYGACP
jgi:hypothetical protein